PKFPEPVNLVFLLDRHRRGDQADPAQGFIAAKLKGPDPLVMVMTTLDHIARGGIRDHLGGGYHRYSTDRAWVVPHFEKMLYDNAQLAAVFVLAFEATGDPRWRREAEETFAFVERTMTSPEGAFYSALDAETNGDEGAYYVWTRDEVKRVLGDGADYSLFAKVYGLEHDPNFENDRYVLLMPRPLPDVATALDTTPEALEGRLTPLRAKLLAAREKRTRPRLDDKVLTSWNGLMIAAYAEGYRVLKDERYRRAAERAADLLLAKLRTPEGRLLRTYRAGQAKLAAYLEDYAFLAFGLLRLHTATSDPKRLDQARALADRLITEFGDAKAGGFFYTAEGHEGLLARPKDPYDQALPSGNSVAIRLLVALGAATKEARYLDAAGQALETFSSVMSQVPASVPLMLIGLDEYLDARPEAARSPLGAEINPKATGSDREPIVMAEASLAPAAMVAPGRTCEATLTIRIKEGWHLYAHEAEAGVPTTVTLAEGGPAALAGVDYPQGELRALAGAERVAVYEDRVSLPLRLRIAEDARAGPAELTLRVRYQACNDRSCLAPASLSVPLRLTIGRK
ncbi:MAG: AGE family epimerase/isomerase, partial [Isosphaeraceae bacterium]|nr:AGE family epimerase/isomerase [Isosphaeraceae bacterium]